MELSRDRELTRFIPTSLYSEHRTPRFRKPVVGNYILKCDLWSGQDIGSLPRLRWGLVHFLPVRGHLQPIQAVPSQPGEHNLGAFCEIVFDNFAIINQYEVESGILSSRTAVYWSFQCREFECPFSPQVLKNNVAEAYQWWFQSRKQAPGHNLPYTLEQQPQVEMGT